MDIGSLRHLIRVVKPVMQKDSFGSAVESGIEEVFVTRCRILPVSAKEFALAGTTGTVGTYQVTMRYNAALTDKMRIEHPASGKKYEIISILPDGKYRSMTVRVNEVTL